ncbi:MAG: 1,2-phenylacetyl-CoA epoxidase subunit PaaD [Sphingomonadaceae bacterium]
MVAAAKKRDSRQDRLWGVLESVPDPEIPVVSIVDLGIVRAADAEKGEVAITPTYTGCPATAAIRADLRAALDEAGFGEVDIVERLSPPWTTDWISEEGRAKLEAYGIAPPQPEGAKAIACPQCGSADTAEISRFGSTPCKALRRCTACDEPFDYFKCH